MNDMTKPTAAAIKGEEHWTSKDGAVKLFLFEKCAGDPAKSIGTILFVHGSSMASQPTFDLQVPGRPDSSAMDYFASRATISGCRSAKRPARKSPEEMPETSIGRFPRSVWI